MNYLALALTLLLAVGSRAAPMSSEDVTTTLAQVRSIADAKLEEMKTYVMDNFGNTDPNQRAAINQRFEAIKENVATMRAHTNDALQQAMVATEGLRASVNQEIESLRSDLEPHRARLATTFQSNLAQYRRMIEPITSEYSARHQAEVDALRAKMEPIMAQMRERAPEDWQQTKDALIPILDTLKSRGGSLLERTRSMVEPHIQEYRDQFQQMQAPNPESLASMRQSAQNKAQELAEKLGEIMAGFAATVNAA